MKKMVGQCPQNGIVELPEGVLARIVGRRYPIREDQKVTMIEMIDQTNQVIALPRRSIVELVKTPEELAADYLTLKNLVKQLGNTDEPKIYTLDGTGVTPL